MNEALNFVEENLMNEIGFQKVASLAFCSEYHFKGMFSFLAGITLSEYIRRRRLTLAAFELKDSNVKVITIAMKYGYNSPESYMLVQRYKALGDKVRLRIMKILGERELSLKE